MATITLKNLPDDLRIRLKERAAQNRRSLNSEVIACLEQIVGPERRDPDQVLKQARAIRKKVGGHLTERQLDRYKRIGRP